MKHFKPYFNFCTQYYREQPHWICLLCNSFEENIFIFKKKQRTRLLPTLITYSRQKHFQPSWIQAKSHLEVPEYRFGFNQISIYDQAFKIHNPDLLSFQIQIKWGGGSSMKPNISREVTLIPV